MNLYIWVMPKHGHSAPHTHIRSRTSDIDVSVSPIYIYGDLCICLPVLSLYFAKLRGEAFEARPSRRGVTRPCFYALMVSQIYVSSFLPHMPIYGDLSLYLPFRPIYGHLSLYLSCMPITARLVPAWRSVSGQYTYMFCAPFMPIYGDLWHVMVSQIYVSVFLPHMPIYGDLSLYLPFRPIYGDLSLYLSCMPIYGDLYTIHITARLVPAIWQSSRIQLETVPKG